MFSRIKKFISTYSKALIVLPTLACSVTLYQNHKLSQEHNRLNFSIALYEAETRILKDEIREKENCPSYDDGYNDAIIRSCGNWGGDYHAGWKDCLRTIDYKSYADGYHACLRQFSYQSQGKEIVPQNKVSIDSGPKELPEMKKDIVVRKD